MEISRLRMNFRVVARPCAAYLILVLAVVVALGQGQGQGQGLGLMQGTANKTMTELAVENCTDNWRIPLGQNCSNDTAALARENFTATYAGQDISQVPGSAWRPIFASLCWEIALCTEQGNCSCKASSANCSESFPMSDPTTNCDQEFAAFYAEEAEIRNNSERENSTNSTTMSSGAKAGRSLHRRVDAAVTVATLAAVAAAAVILIIGGNC